MKRARWSVRVALALAVGLVSGHDARAQRLPDAPSAMVEQSAGLALGSVSGVVKDIGGTPVGDATVKLAGAAGAAREAVTDDAGAFRLDALPAGAYTVTVSAEGLENGSVTVTLAEGERKALPVFLLPVATVKSEVTAVSQKQMADIQIAEEEKQRLFGILPNFYVAYDEDTVPLDTGQKYKLAVRTAIDWTVFVSVAVTSGIQQGVGTPHEWNQNLTGYGQRFGANLAGTEVGIFLEGAVLPGVFHQDPRYFYKGKGTVRSRVWWALKQTVEQRGDNGRWQPGYANITGDVASSAVTTELFPQNNINWGKTVGVNLGLALVGDAIGNVLEEFVFNHVTTRKH